MPARRILQALAPLLLLAALGPYMQGAYAAPRCFSNTNQCLDGRIRQYWEANGGLAVFGLSITAERPEESRDTGQTYQTQWLERNRFELHPEHAAPYDVLLGRLGADRLRQLGIEWQTFPKAQPGTLFYFAETGQAILHRPFAEYWDTHGLELGDTGVSDRESLALFGYPISPARMETNANGDKVLTQWFERARFEYHPGNPDPYKVLLGLLGVEMLQAAGQPVAPPSARPIELGLELVAGGLSRPVFVTHAGDGSGALFVVEQAGTIRRLPDKEIFLDMRDRVLAGGERGLLGLAFHPDYRNNGFLYVNYTDRRGDTVIARFTARPDRRSADPVSEHRILHQAQPAANHNGGMLAFGPDGYLYIGLGDGGGANDTYRNAQNRRSLLGKVLRIDVDGAVPYAIPPGNPFVGDPTGRAEVWAYGLRNPWRFSFDRATGDLFIGDVGQNRYEWVHYQRGGSEGGQNYGWPIVEGPDCLVQERCDRSGLTAPIGFYSHDAGCAISGGYVYRGTRAPALAGHYLFGDVCSGRIWTLRQVEGRWTMLERLKTELQISSFGEDEAGEVYVVDLAGSVYRITAVTP